MEDVRIKLESEHYDIRTKLSIFLVNIVVSNKLN